MAAPSEDETSKGLEAEINTLREQVASLKKQVKTQATNLVISDTIRQLLHDGSNKTPFVLREKLLARSDAQAAHDQQSLYRMGAAVTTFRMRDPDPNAVDDGKVLGLRFEIMSKARFLRPYYVLLRRPYPDSRHLRVHRHTIPPCIPLSGLAARHLPAPGPADADAPTTQDLLRFARTLRREIVRYHNRAAVIGDLGRAAAARLDSASVTPEADRSTALVDVRAADAQAKQAELAWADGRTGRLVMDDDGQLEKLVVFRDETRDRETTRALRGDSRRVEDIAKRMNDGIHEPA
ncbi:hypothetical protein HYQ45_003909 [Verticillium longisporum]|uniref:Cenp-O kinetochore centromere component n=1 Tax=Verticillium longisporum TaxID=100787 RepID=A0A0G4LYG7_VERLO|nr:hypothetical protein HYQ44_012556 [Verticillium longisporum]KAG7138863.1 hypothetical protein HYQ45_003909 [Verticillium longisporum]CRK27039.1 hypothetical protein BN1708_004261 [Verticillium longisporum]CRK29995.1 hypothetical protein BN1723_014319 [Verticillium longisporum]